MPDATYPMLRARRRSRRRLSLPALRWTGRRLATLIAAGALVTGLAVAARPHRETAAELLQATVRTLAAGNYSAARRNGARAVAAAPGSVPAHLALARADLRLGDGLAAQAELTRAVDAGARAAWLHPLVAHAMLLQGDTVGAIAETARASAGNAYADRVRALALAAQGKGAAAQALLTETTARAPRDAAAWTALGRLRLSAGEPGDAATAATTAVRLAPGEPAALTLEGEVVRAQYGLTAALPWFAAALKRDAYHVPALIEQAATLGEAGRYAEALAATRAALAARPRCAPALYLQAVIAARAGKLDLARRLLAASDGALDALPGAMLLQGALDQAAGRREQAVAWWRRLLTGQPMNLAARRLLAAALLHGGDARSALDLLWPLALMPDADAYSLTLAARAWERTGGEAQAAQLLDRAAAEPGRAGSGMAAVFAADETPAALAADAGTAPGDPTYLLGVVRGLLTGGDGTGAVARAQALAHAAPNDPTAQQALGDVLAARGDWPTAAAAYARAADRRFDEPTALRLIDALGRAGRGKDAAAALALYLGQNPQSLTGRRLLGHWQVTTAAWSAAIETLEGVRRQLGDRDAGLLADLSLAYAGADEGALAQRYAAAAYRLQPMAAHICDAYGVALAANGEVEGARQLLAKAAALAPGDPVIAAHRRPLA